MFGSQEVLGECEHACASLWELRPEALTERWEFSWTGVSGILYPDKYC